MASYPTAAKTFTTRNAGDTIQPGHVNDLQDEVAAIEAGLLNGTAPLNSSNSTLAALSVSGKSTFANSVQMSSNCTIAGTLTANKIVSTSLNPTGLTTYVKAYLSSVTELSSAASTAVIGLNAEVADLLNEFDVTTFTFTPQSSGYYHLIGRCRQSSVQGTIGMRLTVNGSNVASAMQYNQSVAEAALTVSALLNLSSGSAGAVQMLYSQNIVSTSRLSTGAEMTTLEILRIF